MALPFMDLEKLPHVESEVGKEGTIVSAAATDFGGSRTLCGVHEDRRHAKPPLTSGPTPGGRGGAVLGG